MNRTGRTALATALLCSGLLASCGGGGGGGGGSSDNSSGSTDCSLRTQQTGLRSYMLDWYLFNTQMPNPDPAAYNTIEAYFYDLLASPSIDPWSYVSTTASFDQFFTEGKTLGYGMSVAGQPQDPVPVRIRYIAPGSPADLAGLTRGMVIESINGVDAAIIKASRDGFIALTSTQVGQTLTLRVRQAAAGSAVHTVNLSSVVYTLQPVAQTQTFTRPNGRQVAYLHYKDFISSGQNALQTFFQTQVNQGTQDLILDMRYNGGGRVSIAADLASAIAGYPIQGQRFALLRYNANHQDANHTYNFGVPMGWVVFNLPRVYVLAGPRTCSASELVINGLKPFVQVIQIGGTTCGKPYGFNPVDHCGNTYSAVNFDSLNAQNIGGYVNGITPTCSVADDLDHALGDPAEALTAVALQHIDTGQCPATATRQAVQPLAAHASRPGRPLPEGDRPPGMW